MITKRISKISMKLFLIVLCFLVAVSFLVFAANKSSSQLNKNLCSIVYLRFPNKIGNFVLCNVNTAFTHEKNTQNEHAISLYTSLKPMTYGLTGYAEINQTPASLSIKQHYQEYKLNVDFLLHNIVTKENKTCSIKVVGKCSFLWNEKVKGYRINNDGEFTVSGCEDLLKYVAIKSKDVSDYLNELTIQINRCNL